MKILSNYSSGVNFGYDKKLNKELKKQLSEYPDKRWAETIDSMNTFCNNIEDNIKSEEKNKNNDKSKFQDYLDMFLTFKETLAAFIEITFDNLHYADREYMHYDKQHKKHGSQKEDWRLFVCKSLSDWISFPLNDELKDDKKVSAEYVPQAAENSSFNLNNQNLKPENSGLPSSVSNTFPQLSQKSFLEEFKKDSSTPSGFSDVAGMDELKRDLREGIIEYIQNPEQAQLDFEEYGKTIPKAVLLYGPPGCGKTYITQALASEIDTPVYALNISKAGSHYINMTSKNIKSAFDEATKIAEKTQKPCILFMDEIDSLGFDRSSRMEPDDLKQVTTMLQSLDEAKKSNVIIIGATNKYNLLDPALRRRFDAKIHVDIPDFQSRKALLARNLSNLSKGQKLLSSDKDLDLIAKNLQGFSNSSICNISKQAALNALRRNRDDISVEDYLKAIETTSEEKPDRKIYASESGIKSGKIGFSAPAGKHSD